MSEEISIENDDVVTTLSSSTVSLEQATRLIQWLANALESNKISVSKFHRYEVIDPGVLAPNSPPLIVSPSAIMLEAAKELQLHGWSWKLSMQLPFLKANSKDRYNKEACVLLKRDDNKLPLCIFRYDSRIVITLRNYQEIPPISK